MNRPQLSNSPITCASLLSVGAMTNARCEIHGPYEARVIANEFGTRPVTTPCPDCREERQSLDNARKEREAKVDRQRRVASLKLASGIPARYAESSFAAYEATTAEQKVVLRMCKAFSAAWPQQGKNGSSLLMTGGPGTGKTSLACAIGNEIIEQHLASVSFGAVSSMLRRIKESYRKDSKHSEQDALNEFVRPDLLILDEIGVQVGSDHEKLLMFEVLNARYQECRGTILVSNLCVMELEQYLGYRLMDRYRECGAVLAFDWESFRGRRSSSPGLKV